MFDSGRPSITDIGVADPAAAPEKPRRDRSRAEPRRSLWPSTLTTWAAQTGRLVGARGSGGWPTGRPGARRTRSARRGSRRPGAPPPRRGGASTSSAYDVISISRGCAPKLVSDTRRSSASSSGETMTSSVVVERAVSPVKLGAVLEEGGGVLVGVDPGRLVGGRPYLSGLGIAQEDVGPPGVPGGILAPAGDRQAIAAAVARAGGGQHDRIAAVGQKVRARQRIVDRGELAEGRLDEVADVRGRPHLLDAGAGHGYALGGRSWSRSSAAWTIRLPVEPAADHSVARGRSPAPGGSSPGGGPCRLGRRRRGRSRRSRDRV